MLTTFQIQKVIESIAEKYNVKKVDLFGSYANGTATSGSDVDLIVSFNIPVPSIFKVMGFREEAALLLGYSVDVVTLPLSNPEKLSIDKVVKLYEQA